MEIDPQHQRGLVTNQFQMQRLMNFVRSRSQPLTQLKEVNGIVGYGVARH